MTKDYEKIKELLLEIMGGEFDLKTEKASLILDILDAAPEADQVPLLAFVLGRWKFVSESDCIEKGRRMSDKRFQELQTSGIFNDLKKAFHVWIRRNPSEEELARKVWSFLKRYEGNDEQDFLLTQLLSDEHVPYKQISEELYHVDLESLGLGEEFPETADAFVEEGTLVQSIINRVSEPTILTKLLWNVINRQPDSAKKFTIFATIMALFHARVETETISRVMDSLKEFMRRLTVHVGLTAIKVPPELGEELKKLLEKFKKK